MEKIEIQVPPELMQQLRPYQANLSQILELGLRYLEEQPSPQSAELEETTEQILSILQKAGTLGPDETTMSNYLAQPENQKWQPLQARGKPASEIIIEQRRGLSGD